MRYTLVGILMWVVGITGCACQVKTVYVPVSSCPAPPYISMPELAVDRLPQKPETKDALKALMDDHITLKGSLEQCITALDGYRKK